MREVERYCLDKVRVTSAHSMGSGINLVERERERERERGWTLFHLSSRVREVKLEWLTYRSLAWGLNVGVFVSQ